MSGYINIKNEMLIESYEFYNWITQKQTQKYKNDNFIYKMSWYGHK